MELFNRPLLTMAQPTLGPHPAVMFHVQHQALLPTVALGLTLLLTAALGQLDMARGLKPRWILVYLRFPSILDRWFPSIRNNLHLEKNQLIIINPFQQNICKKKREIISWDKKRLVFKHGFCWGSCFICDFFHYESPANFPPKKIGRGFTRPTEVIKVQAPRATTKSLVPTDWHGLV